MATYNPPTENLAIFDPSVFAENDVPLTTAEGDKRYLRFPNAQGTENLATTNVNGILTANSTTNINGILTANSTTNINGVANFSNNVNIGSVGTANLTPVITTNKSQILIGNGGNGQMDFECPLNIGGFGSLTLGTNNNLNMQQASIINQTGTKPNPNVLASTNITSGSNIKYLVDNTEQTSAFTGAGALAGNYTSTNMTLDANGRITAISNGTSNGDADMLYLTNTTGCLDASQIVNTNWSYTTSGFQPAGVRCIHTNSTGQYIALAQNTTGYSLSTNYGQSFTTTAGVYASERARGVAFSASGRFQLIQTGNGVAGQIYWSASYGNSFTGLLPFTITSGADTCIDTTCMDADGTRFYTLNLTSGNVPTLYNFTYFNGVINYTTVSSFAGFTSFINMSGLRCSADGKYVIFNGTTGGTPAIFHSSDYGATFVRTTTPPNNTLNVGGFTVGMSKTGEIMVGVMRNTSNGNTAVFVSNNYGNTWGVGGNYLVNASAGFELDRIALSGDANLIVATGTDTAGNTYFYATSNLGYTWYEATGSNSAQRFCALSNDGSLIYAQRPTPYNDFVFTSFPLHTSNTVLTQSKYNFTACPSYFEDFTAGTLNGTVGSTLLYRFTGAGAVSIYEGAPLNANIQAGYNGRIGCVVMNTTTGIGDACLLATEETFRLANIKSITYGFNLCGNEAPTSVANGVDFGNGDQYMGLTSEVLGDDGAMGGTTILFRYLAPAGATANWTLVENNVIKETITGTNLTGGMSNKWHRCTLYFINGGTQYYGIWYNLTNGVFYQTNTYTISGTTSVNTNVCSCIGISTSNATAKYILWDYVLIEPNTLPINGGISQTTSR